MVCEVDGSTLSIPDVLPVHDDVITNSHGHPRSDVQVVLHQHREISRRQLDEELLMPTRGSSSVGQHSYDGRVGGDLHMGTVGLEVSDDGGIVGLDCGGRTGTQQEPERDQDWPAYQEVRLTSKRATRGRRLYNEKVGLR